MLGTEHDFFGQLNRHFENRLYKIFENLVSIIVSLVSYIIACTILVENMLQMVNVKLLLIDV